MSEPADVPVVIGVDVGGTHTRALVAAGHTRLASARGPGANAVSSPLSEAVQVWHDVIADCLEQARLLHPGLRPRHCVIGAAGAAAIGQPLHVEMARLRDGVSLPRDPRVVLDIVTSFTAGTERDSGLVLISGTGAVAGRVRDDQLVGRVDGHGWLVGDDGSGHWIGRSAVRAALDALEGGPATSLLASVCAAVEAQPGIDSLLRAVYAMPPRGMATLAPLVGEAAGQGDSVAERILDEATQVLVETLARLGPGPEDTVVVLAGGVATEQSMLSGRLEQAVTARWELPVTYGLSGAWGAVRIAHRDLAARLD